MLLRRLEITGVRNLESASLPALSPINIIFGNNGAGKTSILEAVSLLSSARSFRSSKLKPLVNNNMDKCVAFGEVSIKGGGFQPVGVVRPKATGAPSSIKVNGLAVRSAAVLADNLPLQVIYSDSFQLLTGAPAVRRNFLDWGVFHVEHRFHGTWKRAQRCLKQRNTLLRRGRIKDGQLSAWTDELVMLSEHLDSYRQAYIQRFLPVFNEVLDKLIQLDGDGFDIRYFKGWDKERQLGEIYKLGEEKELALGYTQAGYHRADLKFRYAGATAGEVLSRGQQKLVICALRVAQGFLLAEATGRQCVYLVDDLPAELDKQHRKALCHLLEEMGCQVFVTCVDPTDIQDCWATKENISMFHVEHGKVEAVKQIRSVK